MFVRSDEGVMLTVKDESEPIYTKYNMDVNV